MLRKRKEEELSGELVPVPDELPPIVGLDDDDDAPEGGSRIWLWTLIVALAVALVVVFVLSLGVLGFYDGLRDRAEANRQLAQEHYALGLAYLESGDYELSIAEFDLALRHDARLQGAEDRLEEAKELARAQVMPTSETRRDAAALLYRQAVPHYEDGNLVQAVAMLEELRALNTDYQRENVETMLVTAHFQLGLNAAQEDRLDEAADHFEMVLSLRPDDEEAQDQLNLLDLYSAALKHWDQDWSAAIQALKGLHTLAPEYKDVGSRLHNAYTFHAEELSASGDWCRASESYAAAVEIFPLEAMVDKRDDAVIRCQATAEAPTPAPTSRATARPTRVATAAPQTTATPTVVAVTAGSGRIAFTSYDAIRQRFDVRIVDPALGNADLLREHASQPSFAPGGKRLVFRNHDPSRLGLGILDLGTNEVSELTAYAEDATPAWSLDGQHIVFASNKHGDRRWRIYVSSPGEVRGEGEEMTFGQMPAWSPDAGKIAYHGCDQRGDNCGVRVINAGGSGPARLTTDPSDTAPSWSPDGSRVAFASTRGGNWDLYVVEVPTGQETRLTEHPAADVAPTWSPDGKQIAFLSSRDGTWAVYILDLESGQAKKLIDAGDTCPDVGHARLSWVP